MTLADLPGGVVAADGGQRTRQRGAAATRRQTQTGKGKKKKTHNGVSAAMFFSVLISSVCLFVDLPVSADLPPSRTLKKGETHTRTHTHAH